MLRHTLGGSLCFGLLALQTSLASAEAGPPPCPKVKLIEVFAGAPGCEDVGYVVIEAYIPGELDADLAYINLGPGVTSGEATFETVSLVPWTDEEESTRRLLIGTATVAQYFGIEPDIELSSPFPLRPDGGWVEGCGRQGYGLSNEYMSVNACTGQAIHFVDYNTAKLVEPAPVTAAGERGEWVGCGPGTGLDAGATADAGVLDASVALEPLCTQIYPAPDDNPGGANTPDGGWPDGAAPPLPPDPEGDSGTGAGSPDSGSNSGSSSGSSSGADSGNNSSTDSSTHGSEPPLAHSDGGTSTSTGEDTQATDTSSSTADAAAGTSPSAPVADAGSDASAAPPATGDDAAGCDCAVGTRQTPQGVSLAGLGLGLALVLLRRRRVARKAQDFQRRA